MHAVPDSRVLREELPGAVTSCGAPACFFLPSFVSCLACYQNTRLGWSPPSLRLQAVFFALKWLWAALNCTQAADWGRHKAACKAVGAAGACGSVDADALLSESLCRACSRSMLEANGGLIHALACGHCFHACARLSFPLSNAERAPPLPSICLLWTKTA